MGGIFWIILGEERLKRQLRREQAFIDFLAELFGYPTVFIHSALLQKSPVILDAAKRQISQEKTRQYNPEQKKKNDPCPFRQ